MVALVKWGLCVFDQFPVVCLSTSTVAATRATRAVLGLAVGTHLLAGRSVGGAPDE